ncbi:MAG: hypothetical protein BWK79_05145 [Beggiatoa sp. IS2]|nr:MAG: hypothetical protein BWK79_05145 [Beggiatoa sp. IS2]
MNDMTKDIDVTQLEVTESGLFSFQGSPATIYLKESGKRSSTLKKNVDQSAKFHVSPCPTIGDPRSSKRLQRYVATTRTDGFFPVLGTTSTGEVEEVAVKLQVCRACLAKLNYKSYNSCDDETQDELADRFDIKELFNQYPIVPAESDAATVIPAVVETTVPNFESELAPVASIAEPIAVTKPVAVEIHFSESQQPLLSQQSEPLPLVTTQKENLEKKDKPVAKIESTILTNIYVLQALLKRLTRLFF